MKTLSILMQDKTEVRNMLATYQTQVRQILGTVVEWGSYKHGFQIGGSLVD
jgi:hypothetical protein